MLPLSGVVGDLTVVQVLTLRPLLLLPHAALHKEDGSHNDEQN